MKAILRIPAKEQYGYVEIEIEHNDAQLGSDIATFIEGALETYEHVLREYKGGEGLPEKDFNEILDNYIYGEGDMVADDYAEMNPEQKMIIQSIKRSKKRITYAKRTN